MTLTRFVSSCYLDAFQNMLSIEIMGALDRLSVVSVITTVNVIPDSSNYGLVPFYQSTSRRHQ